MIDTIHDAKGENGIMKVWYETLTEEQKKKLAALGENPSLAALTHFCHDEGLELPEALKDVAAGGKTAPKAK